MPEGVLEVPDDRPFDAIAIPEDIREDAGTQLEQSVPTRPLMSLGEAESRLPESLKELLRMRLKAELREVRWYKPTLVADRATRSEPKALEMAESEQAIAQEEED